MFIDPTWRIVTIGDGDLSFSRSLVRRQHRGKVVASVYDSQSVLKTKYQDNEIQSLADQGIVVHTSIDVTDPESVQRIEDKFDLAVFQFPLIESIRDVGIPDLDSNLLNRRLLRCFIKHSLEHLLCPKGPQLCYISTKDVYPYRDWNIEYSLANGLPIDYLGMMEFDVREFPGYRIRNIRRDSQVADTRAITHAWGGNAPDYLCELLSIPGYISNNHCPICRAGPFRAEEDRTKHYQSKKHTEREQQEAKWLSLIEKGLLL